MTCLEHYFENLLIHGKDVNGDLNKKMLTKEQQEAVEICAQYVKYTYCPTCNKNNKEADN